MTRIISAFPGTGKTYFCQNTELKALDSDSSKFSWIAGEIRNPLFPHNYIGHIKNSLDKVKVILVSSHKIVRDAIAEEGMEYCLVYPDIKLKEEYIERFIRRRSPKEFIDSISKNWDNWILEIESEEKKGRKDIKLLSGKYLNDVIHFLI